jgi:hypothetical protein
MPQARRSRFRFPIISLDFTTDLTLPGAWSTKHLTETSTRNLPGGKIRPAPKADNVSAIYERTV